MPLVTLFVGPLSCIRIYAISQEYLYAAANHLRAFPHAQS